MDQYVDAISEADTARELWRLETQWANALETKDAAALTNLLADSFTSAAPYQPSEPVNKFDYIAEATRTIMSSCEVSNLWIRHSGNLAVVREEFRFKSPLVASSIHRCWIITDLWVRDGRQWKAMTRLVSSKALQ